MYLARRPDGQSKTSVYFVEDFEVDLTSEFVRKGHGPRMVPKQPKAWRYIGQLESGVAALHHSKLTALVWAVEA